MADIEVSISEAVSTVNKQGFGRVLVICTTKASSFTIYDTHIDLTSLAVDFASTTDTYKMVAKMAEQSPRPKEVAVFGVDLSASTSKAVDLTTALNSLIIQHNNWYRILLDDQTEPLITAVATWALANGKVFYTQFGNHTFTTDFSTNGKVAIQYKANTDRIDCAMAGYATTRVPGSFTFKFRGFNGITADSIAPADQTAIKAKNMNMYLQKYADVDEGSAQLDSGIMANGLHIDDVESQDWVKYRIMQEIVKLLVNTPKVPYNNTGMQQVVKAIDTALQDAFKNGIIDSLPNNSKNASITYPNVADIVAEDRANRVFSGISFTYLPLGAVEGAIVTGTVQAQV